MRPAAAVALVALAVSSAAAEDVLKPADNLVTDGLPPIPAALAEQVGRYTESRSAGLFDWHPSRREILIGTRFGQTTQVHRVKVPGGDRRQLTFFAEGVGGAKFEPKGGSYFVFSRDVGGNERYQNYRYDLGSGAVTLLTDGKSRNSPGVWANAGGRMAYTSTRRTGRDNDLYVIDPADPKSDRKLADLGVGWSVLDWSPDDSELLVVEYVSINESYLWLVGAATGEKTALTPRKGGAEPVSYGGGQFARDGKAVWTTGDKGSEFRRLVRIDLGTKDERAFTADIPWDVEDVEVSPDGKTVAFLTNEAGVGVLRLLDTATGKLKPTPPLPPGTVSGLQWHRSGRELAFHLTSAKHPRDVFSLDPASGKVERWTESETGGLDTSAFPEPELVKWPSFDGREISGFLYRPPGKFGPGKRPVIVNIHGGPEGQSRPGYLGAWNYYPNELGVALIYPNVRGSSGFGKTFLKLDNGLRREDSYKDIAALLDWIKTRPDLDADRVMVTGGSYGGHMTLAVATYYPDRIRCAVDVVGISNLRTFLENTEPYRRDLRRAEYGDERDPKVRAFMERTAPVNNADKITKPLFVIQGLNDPRVPASEAAQMVSALKRRGTPVWYLAAKDEGHGFAKKRNVEFQAAATAAFVRQYLLGE
jgi:dipeptidyl aminopeptidase/acylaminoacyl peptidase